MVLAAQIDHRDPYRVYCNAWGVLGSPIYFASREQADQGACSHVCVPHASLTAIRNAPIASPRDCDLPVRACMADIDCLDALNNHLVREAGSSHAPCLALTMKT